MKTPTEEYADRQDEAAYWRTHKASGGHCALVALLLIMAPLFTAIATLSL